MSFSRANTSNNPAKALELVRAALQPSLNADIERVLLSYQEVSYSHIHGAPKGMQTIFEWLL